MKHPCSTCMEKSRCEDGKAECFTFLKYRRQRKRNIEKNKERWKNGQLKI